MIYTKIFIESYGCSANHADAEVIAGLLKNAGYQIIQSPHNQDLNIIVSCCVKEATFQRMINRIKILAKSGKPLVVAGCMPATEANVISKINPNASLLGPNSLDQTVYAVKMALIRKKTINLKETYDYKLLKPRIKLNPIIGIVQIASGCLSACSFCQVRLARGRLKSLSSSDILNETDRLIKSGCKEIWLTSQDNGCYGKEIGSSISELLNKFSLIKPDIMVRVGMMNPMNIMHDIDNVVDAFTNEQFFKFIHLPLQSGSDRILNLMNRNYSCDDFKKIINKFRRKFPQITLSTDIIVGFPGETEEDFQETINILNDIKPDITNISRFSPRSGTKASKLTQLPNSIVKTRSSILHKIKGEIQLVKNSFWIGWQGKVLIDEKVRDAILGRNYAYKPIVLHSTNNLGDISYVKVISSTSNCLTGLLNPNTNIISQ